MTHLGDLHGRIPRDIRECRILLDGIVVSGIPVYPGAVAGIEIYSAAEAPVEYSGTMSRARSCVALIWMK